MLDFEDAENECSTQSNSNILNIFDIEQIIDIDKMYFTGTTDPSLEAIFLKNDRGLEWSFRFKKAK